MTRVLHRISRSACPAADRPWLDALFAEIDAVDPGRARIFWLLGAFGLLAHRHLQGLGSVVTPLTLVFFFAAVVFAVMGITEYEGLALEDDWYPAVSAAFVAALIGVTVINLRRRPPRVWP
jgi:hypothetical protein